jgi:hypothetical protein
MLLPEGEYLVDDTTQGPYIGFCVVRSAKCHLLSALESGEKMLAGHAQNSCSPVTYTLASFERAEKSALTCL